MRDDWIDPDAGRILFREYAEDWIAQRAGLSPRTRERYEEVLRLHLGPSLGARSVASIKEATVRGWRQELLAAGVGPPTVAKSYRLLRAIMNTAADDLLIRRNPCRIKGAGEDRTPERPILTIGEVYAVAGKIPDRFRALVLLATFCSMRFGELAALRRADIDLVTGFIMVRTSQSELKNGELQVKDPKSGAGLRRVAVPAAVASETRRHLDKFTDPARAARVFIGPRGGLLRRRNFQRVWTKALKDAGVPRVHFHDLRHTGNTVAAATGASTRELMLRMGHASTRAALIYQHATSERDRLIAEGIDAQIALAGSALSATQVPAATPPSGT